MNFEVSWGCLEGVWGCLECVWKGLRDSVYCLVCNNAKTIETSSVLPLEAKSALSKILNFVVSWGCLEGVWGCLEGV